MASLELLGKKYRLYLNGERRRATNPLWSDAELLEETGQENFVGRGNISNQSKQNRIEQFIFTTAPTTNGYGLGDELILRAALFSELCGDPCETVLHLLQQNAAYIIDRLCEMHLQTIEDEKRRFATSGQPEYRWLIPEITFAPLSRDFLARHLYGRVPLTFASS